VELAEIGRIPEMNRLIVRGALAASVIGAQAASAAEFYIVRDATTKKCTAEPKNRATSCAADRE